MLNAADSMPNGGELSVRVRRESPTPSPNRSVDNVDTLCVDIADTGGGIAADVLPHIFEPFYTTKKGGKGTGLGLPIAARIVDAHQGSIQVTPREASGTVFTVHLPTLPVAAAGRIPQRDATERVPAVPSPS